MRSTEDIYKLSTQMRRDIIRMIHAVQSGHPGGSLGCADFLATMYSNILSYNPNKFSFSGKDEDVFFLSNGHISAAWYSILARSGFFPVSELATFRKLGSRLQGHPTTAENLPGIRIASGSLGQGLSAAIGCAIGKKLSNDKHFVFTLLGDGELQEGQVWEAALFANAKNVDNLITVIDYNGKQIDGPVDKVITLGDLAAKWKSFGWNVFEMDGHNPQEIEDTIQKAKTECNAKNKPSIIIMKTIMGKGVSFMEDDHKWHGSPTNEEQFKIALSELKETLGDY